MLRRVFVVPPLFIGRMRGEVLESSLNGMCFVFAVMGGDVLFDFEFFFLRRCSLGDYL